MKESFKNATVSKLQWLLRLIFKEVDQGFTSSLGRMFISCDESVDRAKFKAFPGTAGGFSVRFLLVGCPKDWKHRRDHEMDYGNLCTADSNISHHVMLRLFLLL